MADVGQMGEGAPQWRPDKDDPGTVGDSTWLVHGGNTADASSGTLRTPIYMANSYALPDDPSNMDWSSPELLIYARNGHVNQRGLERKLAALERGESAVVFSSGVAALHAVFFTLLRSGDHVIVSDVTYEAVWRLFSELLPERYGIEATFVDVADLDAVKAALRPNTKLIHIEAIANPTTKVADVRALADIGHDHGALLTVDSTFTPPPFYRPLEDGADLVIHSLTKYINGHGDAMGGVVIGAEELVGRIRADALVDVGGVLSPFAAWLINRGSVTLPLRLQRQLEVAPRVAEFLEADPRVAFVAFPGLESHPQHQLAADQFGGRGYGSMMAFALVGGGQIHNDFVDSLNIITSALSLGHDETLIVHSGPEGRGGADKYPANFQELGHLRLSIGLEDPEDIIGDLAQALDAVLPG